MDITTMKRIAPVQIRRERSARPTSTYRLVSPDCVSIQGISLPSTGSLVGSLVGAHVVADATTHTSNDAFSFRRGRPPV
ncbi:hypothetical protein V3N99_16290 [Dermatophilaceae bacterium Soc4.6]